MRVLVSLVFALSLVSGQTVLAVGPSATNPTGESTVNELERHYFDHTFSQDSIEDRVDRLEKFVFGEATEGDPQARMTKMIALLAADEALPSQHPKAVQDTTTVAAPTRDRKRAVSPAPSTNNFSQQSDPSSDDDASASASGSVESPGAHTNYPHVTALESEILGSTFENDAINDRLSRLEMKAFGKSANGQPLSTRTDALEQYAVVKLHKKPFGVNPDMLTDSNVLPSRGSSGGGGGAANSFIDSLPARALTMFSPFPIMFHSAPQQFTGGDGWPTQQEQPARQEDPALRDKNPPPADAQMLTKVGWCEMQLFGHTSSNMHLMDRLRQLNDNLFPGHTHDSGLQLMDKMDAMVAAVSNKRK